MSIESYDTMDEEKLVYKGATLFLAMAEVENFLTHGDNHERCSKLTGIAICKIDTGV